MNSTPPLSSDSAAGYRAVVIDDERPLAAIVASYLERENFEVAVAHNGVDALAIVGGNRPRRSRYVTTVRGVGYRMGVGQ